MTKLIFSTLGRDRWVFFKPDGSIVLTHRPGSKEIFMQAIKDKIEIKEITEETAKKILAIVCR